MAKKILPWEGGVFCHCMAPKYGFASMRNNWLSIENSEIASQSKSVKIFLLNFSVAEEVMLHVGPFVPESSCSPHMIFFFIPKLMGQVCLNI